MKASNTAKSGARNRKFSLQNGTLNYGVVSKGVELRQPGPNAVIAVAILHCPSTVIGNIKKGKSKKHRQKYFLRAAVRMTRNTIDKREEAYFSTRDVAQENGVLPHAP
jgi:hypothetical protein